MQRADAALLFAGSSIMHRKLFLLACIVFISMGTRCLPTSARDGNSGIRGTTSLTTARDGNSGIGGTTSPTSARDGNSGIRGTTHSIVVSGVPGGPTIGGPASVEFAIAPVEADKPIYGRAIFVKSDAQGIFKVELPPGTYWIGPKAKALDPIKYAPGPVEFSETVVEVKAGNFISVELVTTGYAP